MISNYLVEIPCPHCETPISGFLRPSPDKRFTGLKYVTGVLNTKYVIDIINYEEHEECIKIGLEQTLSFRYTNMISVIDKINEMEEEDG